MMVKASIITGGVSTGTAHSAFAIINVSTIFNPCMMGIHCAFKALGTFSPRVLGQAIRERVHEAWHFAIALLLHFQT
jgi:hypothetical protein